MPEGLEEEVFDVEAVLDSIGADGYNPTEKTSSHFLHARQVIQELKNLASFPLVGPPELDNRQRWGLRLSLISVIAQYQYQSYLLDPYLEQMISILIAPIRKVVHDVTIGDFKGQPMNEHGVEVFYMLYFISKTRGYKTIVKFLPHEVADIEPTFEFLRKETTHRGAWETRYMLLIWLSLMCMIPFDLKSIDSQSSKTSDRIPLVDQMMDSAKSYLDRAGKDRDASSLFIARLLTRKDTCIVYLPEFVEWSKGIMSSNPNIFQAIGILGTLCWVFKLGQREVLLPIAEGLEDLLVYIESRDLFMSNSQMKKLIVKLSQRLGLCLLKPRVAAWRYQRGNRSLASNLTTENEAKLEKVSTTIAEETEDDENFDVPEAIESVIERLMNGLRDRDTIVRWSAAKGMGRISNRLPKDMADDVVGSIFELFSEDVFELPNGEPDVSSVSEHTWHGASLAVAELSRRGLLLPHRLTELIPWIILALKFDVKRGAHSVGSNVRDSACYVCWSFARAYTPDVLDSHVRKLSNTLIAVSVFDRDINIRRASSAAFQENVGRMGIFPHGIEIVTVADYFSVGNINSSFLTVAPFIAGFPEYRRYLIEHLLEFVIPHWDIAVREVAADSMAKIAVLDLDYACSDIIPALTKISGSLDPSIRHGALIALGKTCKAVRARSKQPLEQRISEETLQNIGQVVPSVPEFTLSGFGSEHIRQALCVHIACLSEAAWSVDTSVLDSWKSIVNSTLERTEDPLQKIASNTFRSLVAQYEISEKEFEHCLKKIEPETVDRFGQSGFALALGEIDYRDQRYKAWISRAVKALIITTQHDISALEGARYVAYPEARKNAVIAVTNIVKVLDVQYQEVASRELSSSILKMYFNGLQDYSIDHRGDIGSWIREASMQGLEVMIPLVARLDYAATHASDQQYQRYLSDEDHANVLGMLLQQCVEKIDRTRACAASVIVSILYARTDGSSSEEVETEPSSPEYVLRAPHREQIMKVFPMGEYVNWLQPAEVYTRVVQLLNLPEYRSDLLLGFTISAGGLAESLVRHASACLTEFVSNLPITSSDMETDSPSTPTLTLVEFGNELMSIATRYNGQDRVIIPLLEVLDMLFESGCMLLMEDEYDFAPMVRFVRSQTFKCKDTRKLAACIRTYCGLCALGGKIKNAILLELLRLLVHPFPKIRRTTADSMYMMLNGSVDEPTPESEKVGEILMNSDWNKPMAQLTPLRDELYPLLNLEKPKPVPANTASRAK
ncbi:tubulin folding cofactor D C terminal-domain-containing protein [Dissophora ornata]|nr:hypothetical protein BGZ58_011146 [Dissophora ornata]KAI8601668.1 tubulin folding cofactor D C terminal-domain-containing protein [Dissophora ornata]